MLRCAAGERVALSLCLRIRRAVGRHDQVFLPHATHVPASLPGRLLPRQSSYGGLTILRLVGRVQPQQRSAAPARAPVRSARCCRSVRGARAGPGRGVAAGGVRARSRCKMPFVCPIHDVSTTTIYPTCSIGVGAGSRVREICWRKHAEWGVSLAGRLPSYVSCGETFVSPCICGNAPQHLAATGRVRHERPRRAEDAVSRDGTVVRALRPRVDPG